jgi:uncharacterized membrane protein YqjE
MSEAEHASPPRLLSSLRRLAATGLGILQTRLALAGIELEEEIQRLLGMLVLALGAMLFFALGLLVFTLLIVLAFWDEHRVVAFGVLTVLYLGLGGFFFYKLKASLGSRPPIFETTLAELEKDYGALKDGTAPDSMPDATRSRNDSGGV